MTEVKTINSINFVGKVSLGTMQDPDGSFYSQYVAAEEDQDFQKFIADHDIDNVGCLVVFGPENYQYWQGVVSDEAPIPGYLKYSLPATKIMERVSEVFTPEFNVPLSFKYQTIMAEAKKQGINVPENYGLSEHPYYLEFYTKNDNKYLKHEYLYLGDFIEDMND